MKVEATEMSTTTKEKLFQSGSEVLRAYIPGYEPPSERGDEYEVSPEQDNGTKRLLEEFRERLRSSRTKRHN